MSSLSKASVLKWLVIILLLINIATLAYLFIGNRSRPDDKRKGGKDFFAKQLNLSETQKQQFDTLKADFFKSQQTNFAAIKKIKDSLYKQIDAPVIDTAQVVALTTQMSAIQKELEANTFYHFYTLRKICTPEQQVKFDSLVVKMNHMMQRGPRDENKPPPPPEK